MSAQDILSRYSNAELKKKLSKLDRELASCLRCSELQCEIRESCEDNELKNSKEKLYAVDNGFLRYSK